MLDCRFRSVLQSPYPFRTSHAKNKKENMSWRFGLHAGCGLHACSARMTQRTCRSTYNSHIYSLGNEEVGGFISISPLIHKNFERKLLLSVWFVTHLFDVTGNSKVRTAETLYILAFGYGKSVWTRGVMCIFSHRLQHLESKKKIKSFVKKRNATFRHLRQKRDFNLGTAQTWTAFVI
jgi:hypothetical protein